MAGVKLQLPRLPDTYDGRLIRDLVRQIEEAFVPVKVDNTTNETPITGDYTIVVTDSLVRVDTAAANIQVTLPEVSAALLAAKFEVTVKKCAAPNRLRIIPTGSATLDGYTAIDVFVNNTALQFRAVSAGWVIV